MSWGYRITFLYLGFVGIIVTLVTISSRNKEELVSKDYYARELAYQDHLDALANEKSLTKTIVHAVNDTTIILSAPFDVKDGKINFFCPSDSKKDKMIPLTFRDGKVIIPKKMLSEGAYKMQISWKMNGQNYFKEEIITIR